MYPSPFVLFRYSLPSFLIISPFISLEPQKNLKTTQQFEECVFFNMQGGDMVLNVVCPHFSCGYCGFKCLFTKHFANFIFYFTANSDITVVCGTNRMDLQILLCPIYYNGYNETTMALNGQFTKPECKGTADYTADPPVLKFQFFISETSISACSNKLTVLIIIMLILQILYIFFPF